MVYKDCYFRAHRFNLLFFHTFRLFICTYNRTISIQYRTLIISFIVHSFLGAWLDSCPTILLNATLDRKRSSPRAVPSIIYHCRNQLEPCTLKNKNRHQHNLSLVPETDF